MQKSLNINTFYDPRADKLRHLLYFLINQHQIKRVNLVKRLFQQTRLTTSKVRWETQDKVVFGKLLSSFRIIVTYRNKRLNFLQQGETGGSIISVQIRSFSFNFETKSSIFQSSECKNLLFAGVWRDDLENDRLLKVKWKIR